MSVAGPTTKKQQEWREVGRAILYMSPALFFLAAFTYIPFLRSVWLSFFVTTPQGETSRFNGISYYSRIFNLDGSGRVEYLQSVLTTIYFSLLVVPLGIIFALGLALLATINVKAIGFFLNDLHQQHRHLGRKRKRDLGADL